MKPEYDLSKLKSRTNQYASRLKSADQTATSCLKEAKKFEQKFDECADITAPLDLSKAKRIVQSQKRVNVDFPTWMVESLDREASELGVTRQSVIKVWLAERLEVSSSNSSSQQTES